MSEVILGTQFVSSHLLEWAKTLTCQFAMHLDVLILLLDIVGFSS